MNARRIFAIGGFAASLVLLAFGVASIAVGFQGREEVRDSLRQENIVGPADSTIPGQLVDTGSEAKAMANIMREHTLKTTGGKTYAEMGRYLKPDGTDTNNADEAAINEATGRPVENSLRNLWVTETALTTALNTAYFAEQVGLFAIVIGVALVLAGVGFSVLAAVGLWLTQEAPATAKAPTPLALAKEAK
jgi:hypothetical protein